ncbi:hypothetical protein IAG44_28825 [Streptomyces roseirectus]|uniref:Uncharacterized protein n=1 Tax=Streptomyces roseirectus TaxID=2768066 RepID=A0A7H0IJS3_9ACTN|nr:DUF6247 family protein [Streptomyces roseirectus]QNP73039.1 hypothetical protein IAG44_28825 [Streptomyces roseirectus]
MSAQHSETPTTLPPLRTVADIRAALREGRGFPGDKEDFELDLARALDASTAADLGKVAEVIVDYRGRIRLYSDPGFDDALQEGLEIAAKIKKGELG